MQRSLPWWDGTPAQIGSPWTEGDRCQVAKTEPDGPAGRVLKLRQEPRAGLLRQTHVWRALVEWPNGTRWCDLATLSFLEE